MHFYVYFSRQAPTSSKKSGYGLARGPSRHSINVTPDQAEH